MVNSKDSFNLEYAGNIAEDCFHSMIANFPHYIFWKDKASIYLGCNAKFAKLANLKTPEQIIGKTDFDLPWKDIAHIYLEEDKQILRGQHTVESEVPVIMKNNKVLVVSVIKIPLLDTNKNVIGIIGIFSDITERIQAERELILGKQKSEAASIAKSEFIANISHDLKTPLNSILGIAEILQNNRYPDRQSEFVNDIITSANDLLLLIEDVLQYSKQDNLLMNMKIEKFDLKLLLEQLVEMTYQQAKAKHISLNLEYPNDMPVIFFSSPSLIKRIVMNLVGNALKFTQQGNITILVNQVAKINTKFEIQIAVEDTGIGIPADKLDEIFDRFKRLEPSFHGLYPGAGLGLAIVRNLVMRLGGEVYVNSTLGKGSIFFCNLPLQLCDMPKPRLIWLEKYVHLNILIIDNNQIRARVMSHYVGEKNSFIFTQQKLMKELPHFFKSHPDINIVIIDDEIEKSKIEELVTAMSAYLNRDNLLLISSSERNLGTEEKKLFFERVAKPIRPTSFSNHLANCWQEWLSKKNKPEISLAEGEKTIMDPFRVLLVEDEPIAQKFCKLMLDELGYQVDIASTGKEALHLFGSHGYATVITDVGLPDIDGFEVIEAIRAHPLYTSSLRICILTAHSYDEEIKKQYQIDKIISKPASKSDLEQALKKVS